MGVLDDAIREHLELKRRHGVAEEEIRRQEEEALGPARREVVPVDAGDGEGSAEVAAAAADEAEGVGMEAAEPVEPSAADATPPAAMPAEEHEPEVAAETVPEAEEGTAEVVHDVDVPREGTVEPGPLEHATPDETAPYDETEDFSDGSEAPAVEEPLEPKADHPPVEPTFPPPAPEYARTPSGDTPPRGFEELDDDELVEEEGVPEALEDEEGEDADVLEDTPDFLQETPEHDRLWFEQKPPRDFDFD
jgi:hypothetical protein